MSSSPRLALERAREWAQSDRRVIAAFIHGSVAHNDDNELSDLDFIVVAHDGKRDELWAEREKIAARILGAGIAWSWELPWQRPFRYQAWLDDLSMLDFTLDEGKVFAWYGLAGGVAALVDRGGVEGQLRVDMAALGRLDYDAPAFDASTWTLFNWLAGRLLHAQSWFVRASLHDPLANRIVPLLGATTYSAERELPPEDLAELTAAGPASSEPAELLRALRATVALYDLALDRWAARTGRARPQHPLAPAIRARIERLGL
jgi:hypothetical protein